ncbi:MAG: PAS domain-containing protein [Candidatus Syntropharchaeales archaeon]
MDMDLSEEEAFCSKLLNGMVTVVGVLEPDGTVIFSNRMLEDVKGKKLYDTDWWTYSKKVQEQIKADIARCASGERFIHEIQAQAADGSLVWIEFSMHPVFDEEGDLSYLVAESRDISEKKQALDDAQQKVAYLDNMPTYMAVTDLEGNVQFTSAVTIEKFGFKLEDVLGMRFDQMPWWEYSEDIQQRMKEVYERVAKGEEFEFEVDVKMGEDLYPIKYTCEPLRDENGNIYAILHTGTRIDELRAALDDAQQKVAYLNSIPTPIMVVDKEFTIQFVNPSWVDMAGVAIEDAVGRKCYDLIKSAECQTEKCCIRRVMMEDSVITCEKIVHTARGDISTQYTGAPLKDAEGNIIGGLDYLVDITDLKRLIEERERLSNEIMRLSTPIIEVWDKVLMVPLIGTIRTERAEQIMEQLLNEIVKHEAEVVILDLSGIPTIDVDVAQHLLKTASAAKLLGSKVIFTGVRADITEAMVSIGIDLSEIDTRRTLRDGLKEAVPMVKK